MPPGAAARDRARRAGRGHRALRRRRRVGAAVRARGAGGGGSALPSARAARRAGPGRWTSDPTAATGARRRSNMGRPRSKEVPVMDTEALAQLLLETATHHGDFEAVAPPHNWWDWYAAYMNAPQGGSSSEEAVAAADRYMAEVKHIVVPAAG